MMTNIVLTHYALSINVGLPNRLKDNFALDKVKLMAYTVNQPPAINHTLDIHMRLEELNSIADKLTSRPAQQPRGWKSLPPMGSLTDAVHGNSGGDNKPQNSMPMMGPMMGTNTARVHPYQRPGQGMPQPREQNFNSGVNAPGPWIPGCQPRDNLPGPVGMDNFNPMMGPAGPMQMMGPNSGPMQMMGPSNGPNNLMGPNNFQGFNDRIPGMNDFGNQPNMGSNSWGPNMGGMGFSGPQMGCMNNMGPQPNFNGPQANFNSPQMNFGNQMMGGPGPPPQDNMVFGEYLSDVRDREMSMGGGPGWHMGDPNNFSNFNFGAGGGFGDIPQQMLQQQMQQFAGGMNPGGMNFQSYGGNQQSNAMRRQRRGRRN